MDKLKKKHQIIAGFALLDILRDSFGDESLSEKLLEISTDQEVAAMLARLLKIIGLESSDND